MLQLALLLDSDAKRWVRRKPNCIYMREKFPYSFDLFKDFHAQ